MDFIVPGSGYFYPSWCVFNR